MRVAVVVCLLVCTALAGDVGAQPSTGGSIRGTVTDEQNAMLPGVRVTATSRETAAAPAAVTDSRGYYRLVDLPPATYTITAEIDRFAKWVREDVVVRAGLNISIDIAMKVGAVVETIEVRVETPLVESKTAMQSMNISGDFQRELPLTSRRHWSNFIAMAPGVITSNLSTQELTHYHHGSQYNANLTMVDGAESTSAGQTSTLGINYSIEALQDMQVITGGTDATVPLGTGVVVNAVTRSGTNQLRASGALAFQPSQWNGSNIPGGTSPQTSIFQADLGVGGPAKRDVAWLFGAVRHNDVKTGLSRTAQEIALVKALVPSFEPFRTVNVANYYFVKPTAAIGRRHQASGSYRHDINPSENAAATDAAAFSKTRTGGDTWAGRVTSAWSDRVMTAFAAMHTNANGSTRLARTDAPSRRVHAGVLLSNGRLVGTGTVATLDNRPSYSYVPDRKTTVSGDVTVSVRHGGGQHEIRGGVYIDRRHKETQFGYPDGGYSVEEVVLRSPANPSAGTVPFHRQVFDRDQVTLTLIDSLNMAAYAQDSWRPSDRLTVTAGVRANSVKQTDRLFDVRLQNSLDLAPSVGLNYALNASHSSALRGSYARRHEVVTYASAGSSSAGFTDSYDVNLDGTFETVFTTPGSTRLATDRIFDPDRHQPYAEDLNVGVRHQLPGRTQIDIGVFQRRFIDSLTVVEQNGIYQNNMFLGYRNLALNDIYLVTNNVWNHAVYRSIELQVSRQTARVQAVASYTRQWQHLAGTWQPNDPASFIQPGAFANARGIGLASGSTQASDANSLSGTSMVQTASGAGWQPHVLSAAGNVYLWRGWSAAATYNYTSGAWSGPIVTRRGAPDPQFGAPTVVLSNGRLVSNPLATVLRFLGETRTDGQFQMDALHLVGVGVGKTANLRGVTIRAMVQAFNLTNSNAGLQLNIGGNQVFSPNYRQPASITSPRAMLAMTRLEF